MVFGFFKKNDPYKLVAETTDFICNAWATITVNKELIDFDNFLKNKKSFEKEFLKFVEHTLNFRFAAEPMHPDKGLIFDLMEKPLHSKINPNTGTPLSGLFKFVVVILLVEKVVSNNFDDEENNKVINTISDAFKKRGFMNEEIFGTLYDK